MSSSSTSVPIPIGVARLADDDDDDDDVPLQLPPGASRALRRSLCRIRWNLQRYSGSRTRFWILLRRCPCFRRSLFVTQFLVSVVLGRIFQSEHPISLLHGARMPSRDILVVAATGTVGAADTVDVDFGTVAATTSSVRQCDARGISCGSGSDGNGSGGRYRRTGLRGGRVQDL